MKNNNHASKALAVVLSGALAFAPAANAALDESNMAYDSAAEGFYGSLRVQYANNEPNKVDTDENLELFGQDNDSKVEGEGSRLGVRGDVDLGGGLEAFYGFEWNLGDPADGDKALNTRQHHVGLKGDWGSVWLGAFDSVIVRFGGFSTTDILDQYSGNFEPIYRTSNAIAYISPDLNGFQFGIEAHANDGKSSTKFVPDTAPLIIEAPDDGNDFDKIGFGASYSIQGLNFSGAYYQEQDELTINNKESDASRYALGLSYAQDNWIVAAMYGSQELADEGDSTKEADAPFLSLAAGVSIDKFDVHGLWEQQTAEFTGGDIDRTITAISARYHLGSKARLRAAWKNDEIDYGDESDDSTRYALGLQVDF